MDLQASLAIASSAIDLVKSIRQLDHELDKAELKAKMAELYGQLADVKMALVDANSRISELEDALEAQLSGDLCPLCESGRLKVVESRPHKQFAFAGIQTRVVKCTSCEHSEERLYDPEKRTTSQEK